MLDSRPIQPRTLAIMRHLFTGIFFFLLLAGAADAQTRDENWKLCESGDPEHGIAACTALIQSGEETRQNRAIAYSNRGITYSDRGDFDAAIADYERALILNPFLAAALNSLAWDLATMPQAARRDGPRAVELAERALKIDDSQPGFLDTAAAAYAENGQFAKAVSLQEKAVDILRGSVGMPQSVIEDFESRLRLYRNNEPFHRTQ